MTSKTASAHSRLTRDSVFSLSLLSMPPCHPKLKITAAMTDLCVTRSPHYHPTHSPLTGPPTPHDHPVTTPTYRIPTTAPTTSHHTPLLHHTPTNPNKTPQLHLHPPTLQDTASLIISPLALVSLLFLKCFRTCAASVHASQTSIIESQESQLCATCRVEARKLMNALAASEEA